MHTFVLQSFNKWSDLVLQEENIHQLPSTSVIYKDISSVSFNNIFKQKKINHPVFFSTFVKKMKECNFYFKFLYKMLPLCMQYV